jgi:hypothetical protein
METSDWSILTHLYTMWIKTQLYVWLRRVRGSCFLGPICWQEGAHAVFHNLRRLVRRLWVQSISKCVHMWQQDYQSPTLGFPLAKLNFSSSFEFNLTPTALHTRSPSDRIPIVNNKVYNFVIVSPSHRTAGLCTTYEVTLKKGMFLLQHPTGSN